MRNKQLIQVILLALVILCGCQKESEIAANNVSSNSVSENVRSATLSDMGYSVSESVTWKEYAPQSFSGTLLEIDGQMIPSMSNGRYYIFTSPANLGSLVEGETYLYEAYDKLAIRYNPEFMDGEGVMEDIEARGEYHEGIKDLKMVSADISTLSVPDGFEVSELKDGESKFYVWSDGRYYIFRAICNEYEDWYILDSEEKMYVRYEPSFMAGK